MAPWGAVAQKKKTHKISQVTDPTSSFVVLLDVTYRSY
jgi:hypothetical protein